MVLPWIIAKYVHSLCFCLVGTNVHNYDPTECVPQEVGPLSRPQRLPQPWTQTQLSFPGGATAQRYTLGD